MAWPYFKSELKFQSLILFSGISHLSLLRKTHLTCARENHHARVVNSHILSRAEITAIFSHVRKLKMKSNIQSYRFLSQKAFVNPMKVARPRKIAELAIRNYYNNCEMKINSSVATEIINYALHMIHEWKKKNNWRATRFFILLRGLSLFLSSETYHAQCFRHHLLTPGKQCKLSP